VGTLFGEPQWWIQCIRPLGFIEKLTSQISDLGVHNFLEISYSLFEILFLFARLVVTLPIYGHLVSRDLVFRIFEISIDLKSWKIV